MAHCKECGRSSLTKDEIALHKKIYNRGAEEFFCIDGSSRDPNVPVELLREKIVEFKRMGGVRCLNADKRSDCAHDQVAERIANVRFASRRSRICRFLCGSIRLPSFTDISPRTPKLDSAALPPAP